MVAYNLVFGGMGQKTKKERTGKNGSQQLHISLRIDVKVLSSKSITLTFLVNLNQRKLSRHFININVAMAHTAAKSVGHAVVRGNLGPSMVKKEHTDLQGSADHTTQMQEEEIKNIDELLEAGTLLLSISRQAKFECLLSVQEQDEPNIICPKRRRIAKFETQDQASTEGCDITSQTTYVNHVFQNLEVDTNHIERKIPKERTTISPRLSKATARRPLQKPITIEELKNHFNKPIVEVAKEFGVCITLMKKICRKNGIKRWPHRLIRSLDKRIQSAEMAVQATSGLEQQRCMEQLSLLRRKLEAVFENPNIKMKETELDALCRPSTDHHIVADPTRPPSQNNSDFSE